MPLSALTDELPQRVMKADRLKEIPAALSGRFLAEVTASAELRRRLAPDLEMLQNTDLTDGVRFVLDDGAIVHFRASGNAPELRAYVETGSAAQTEQRLRIIMTRMAEILAEWRSDEGV